MIVAASFILIIVICISYLLRQPKKLLILDLNNLLIYRTYTKKFPVEVFDHVHNATTIGNHYTWKRPQLDEFLKFCFKNFEVAVWSSARKRNVDRLCEFIFDPKSRSKLFFEWNQSHCNAKTPHPIKTKNCPLFEKQLKTVWKAYPQYNESNTVILDDSYLKMKCNEDFEDCVGISESWTPWKEGKIETLEHIIKYWLKDKIN